MVYSCVAKGIIALPQSTVSTIYIVKILLYFIDAMLPCEFCEELFPEEDLILHQVFLPSSNTPTTTHK